MTTNINPGPPAKSEDPRFDSWQYAFWDWVQTQVSKTDIIEVDVFNNHSVIVAGTAPGMDVAGSQIIEATQAYARHTPLIVQQPYDVAEKQMILANQIFGG